MNKQRFCFLQVSDSLLNPDDKDNPADVYFKAIWDHLDGEGYFKPEHYWEIPTWIAELSYCLDDRLYEKQLWHISENFPTIIPKADIYLGSIMDCNKEYFRMIAKNNQDKLFYFGGYIGYKEFGRYFKHLANVEWYDDIQCCIETLGIKYRYGTDYSLFKGMKCIPRLTLSNGCINRCRFCTVPDEIIETDPLEIWQQIQSMRDLDFELVYINDKTFGQCRNYKRLKTIYAYIKEFNPKFRGFTIQTTCDQVMKFGLDNVYLKDLGIVNVELGIESYNNGILKKYNKPQNTGLIDLAVGVLEKQGINIIPNIIIGLPGETWGTYAFTHWWLNENKHKFLMLNVTNFVPYVNSDVSDIVKTRPEDLNQTTCKRSYHTKEEMKATKMFSDELFKIGMDIIKATKAKSI